jgi:hypothetical protein
MGQRPYHPDLAYLCFEQQLAGYHKAQERASPLPFSACKSHGYAAIGPRSYSPTIDNYPL